MTLLVNSWFSPGNLKQMHACSRMQFVFAEICAAKDVFYERCGKANEVTNMGNPKTEPTESPTLHRASRLTRAPIASTIASARNVTPTSIAKVSDRAGVRCGKGKAPSCSGSEGAAAQIPSSTALWGV